MPQAFFDKEKLGALNPGKNVPNSAMTIPGPVDYTPPKKTREGDPWEDAVSVGDGKDTVSITGGGGASPPASTSSSNILEEVPGGALAVVVGLVILLGVFK